MSTRHPHSATAPFAAPPFDLDSPLILRAEQAAEGRQVPGLDYYGACRPAGHAAGDFFAFIPPDGHQLLAFIGEAPGAGVPLLAVSAAVDAHFRGIAAEDPDALAASASHLNTALCNVAETGSIMTLFCACIDPMRRVLRYLSAGHEPALLLRAGRYRAHRLEPTGTVLGLTSRTVCRQRTVSLDPGDVLIAFTSGVADAADGACRAFGEAGVADVLRECRDDPPQVLANRVLEAAARHGAGDADQTVIAVRFAGAAGSLNEGRAATLAFAAA
jgi:sigma-B regulation protein RsbU (phosphoserine phosphatase)